MKNEISILLGAGFSAPMGYPIGNTLNNKLLELTTDTISFSPDGRLAISIDGSKPNFGYKTTYDVQFEFCLELIHYYNKKIKTFDYEEFYDYLLEQAINDKEAESLAEPFLKNTDYSQLIFGLKNIFNQLVAFHLKDRNGNKWYDNEPYHIGNSFQGYTGFLRILKSFSPETIRHIHTLNHDMFFERLDKTELISGELCDGFEELGSPYYGNLEKDGRKYLCRLERYTGNYELTYRLYKLHGSLNYGLYYKNEDGNLIPENYIKSRFGIGFSDFIKEVKNKDGNLNYEKCWVNYHSDYLTGTTSKIERYAEPLLYKRLFEIFRTNLNNSSHLIIAGYGAKDSKINEMIEENFDFKAKKVFIIDPYAGDKVKEFAAKINAVLIDKSLEEISINDIK